MTDHHVLNDICLTILLLVAICGQIEETPDPNLKRENMGRVTLGGTQYWTDHFVCQGWRIQRNVKFRQFRLLKPTNRVAESGTFEKCRQAFNSVCHQPDFPPVPATVLVTVHGLGRTRNSMSAIGEYVAERGNFGWVNFGYASTRAEITENARALRHVLDELASLKREQDGKLNSIGGKQRGLEFHFIAHSLGNIIIRSALSEHERNNPVAEPAPWRVGRIVMLGPPNQGSAMANLLKKSNSFRLIAGASGEDLGAEWDELRDHLVTPQCEFAIIAGGKSDNEGFNPLLEGDDDLIVRVEETKLSGATDVAVIPSVHTYLMDRDESKEMALRFLQLGFLRTTGERKPIP